MEFGRRPLICSRPWEFDVFPHRFALGAGFFKKPTHLVPEIGRDLWGRNPPCLVRLLPGKAAIGDLVGRMPLVFW